jgi:TRAP transporter TAXI family solute receptor
MVNDSLPRKHSYNTAQPSAKRRKVLAATGALVSSIGLAGCSGGGGSSNEFLTRATGSTGGTWFPIGGALADLWTDELDATVTAESTGGAIENVRLLEDGSADIGMVFSNTAVQAVNGEDPFDGAVDVQALFGMFSAHTHMVSLAGAGVESPEDLEGLRVSVGQPGSGTGQIAELVLEFLGVRDSIEERQLDLQEQANAMRNGQLDVGFWSNSIPSPSVQELATNREVSFYDFSDEIEDMTSQNDFLTQAEIPAETYSGQTDPVVNPGISNFVFAPSDADEDTIYTMVNSTFSNLDRLEAANEAVGEFESTARSVSIELHPGADRALSDNDL